MMARAGQAAAGPGTMLLKGGLVLDPVVGVAYRTDLWIEDGIIAGIGPAGAVAAGDAPVHDVVNRLIVPGLVNAHTHSHASLMKGVADRWTLEVSLTNGPWLSGARDPETMYLAALLAASDMLSKGCTACFDLVYEFPLPTVEGFRAVAQGYADAGMRAVLAPMVADRSFYQAIPGLLDALPAELHAEAGNVALDGKATLDAVAAIAALGDDLPDGISLAVAPTIPHHCSDGFILDCVAIAERHGLPVHMHIAESRLQVVAAQQLYGMSPVRHLADLGVLRTGFIAAHAIWLDDTDIGLLAEHDCAVAHIPASNLRLGSGVAPVRALLDAGIDVALATDGSNSSDALSMLQAMRLASYLSRLWPGPRENGLSAAETVRMATVGGAGLVGLAGGGRIAEGAPADLALFDLDHIDFMPLADPVNQLVTCADSGAVADVMVAGRFVLADGRLRSPTLDGLGDRVRDAAARLHHDNAGARAMSARFEPHVVAFAESQAGVPVGMDRFLNGTFGGQA